MCSDIPAIHIKKTDKKDKSSSQSTTYAAKNKHIFQGSFSIWNNFSENVTSFYHQEDVQIAFKSCVGKH